MSGKPDRDEEPRMSKAERRRMAAAVRAAEEQAAADAAERSRKARRLQLCLGLSVVGTVAAAPISMIATRVVSPESQDRLVPLLMGAAIVVATVILVIAVVRSHASAAKPAGFDFQVVFGSLIIAGCGTLTANLLFVLMPLVPAVAPWLLRTFHKKTTDSTDGSAS